VKKDVVGGQRKGEGGLKKAAHFVRSFCLETSCSSAVYVERPDEMIDFLSLRDLVREY